MNSGKPAFMPWTTPALVERAESAFKPLAGAAVQSAGTTFARTIKNCPGAVFAVYDVRTGFCAATTSLEYRDETLWRLQQTAVKSAHWFRPSLGEAGKVWWQMFAQQWDGEDYELGGTVDGWPYPWSFPAILYGGPYSLAQLVNEFARRQNYATGVGFLFWFAGQYSIRLPLAVESGNRYDLPLLCAWGVWSQGWGIPYAELGAMGAAFVRESAELGEASQAEPTAPKVLAAAVDERGFIDALADTAASVEELEALFPSAWWLFVRTVWTYRQWPSTFESGRIPPWMNGAAHGAIPPRPGVATATLWEADDGTPLEFESEWGFEPVRAYLNNL